MKDFDTIDNAFDVKSTEIVEAPKKSEIKKVESDPDQDYDYTRGNLYSLIEKGQEAVNGILELAQESDSVSYTHLRAHETDS